MPETTLTIKANDEASSKISGLTGSIITAEAAFEAGKEVLNAVIEAGKKAVEEWGKQETALASLRSVAGTSTNKFAEYADQMRKLTNIDDEVIMGAEKFGLQIGISKGKIEEATKGAIGLSVALGMDLNGAMKAVANVQEGNYQMLQRYIPALRNASTEAEKHAIVMRVMASGMDEAKAKTETFQGTLLANQLATDELYKSYGKIIAIVSQDYIKSMTSAAEKTNEFINSQDGIRIIGGVYAGLNTILQTIILNFTIGVEAAKLLASAIGKVGSIIKDVFSGKSVDIKKYWDQLVKDGQDAMKKIADQTIKVIQTPQKAFTEYGKKHHDMTNQMGTDVKEVAKAYNYLEEISSESFKKQLEGVSMFTASTQEMMSAMYSTLEGYAEGDKEKMKSIKTAEFWINKALAVTNSIISTLEGQAKAFTLDPTGTLSTIIGVEGAIKTAMIAAQPMPAFANGGITSGGLALVGEKGPEIVALPSGTQVYNNQQSQKMMNKGMTFNNVNIIANNPYEFVRKTNVIQKRYELGRGI